jgi:hypothetical protein
MIRRRRDEEGQVYPALLLAVIGGFAIAVAFVALQFGLDQTGRAASASDAAALAVGREHRESVVDLFGDNNGLHLGQLTSFLSGAGPVPGANDVADDYAEANGADLVGDVEYRGFDLSAVQWEYEVTTEQLDTVEGADEELQSRSTSRVAVRITSGLCPGLAGVMHGGDCLSPTEYTAGCVPPPPPPSPTPTASPTTTESPGSEESPGASESPTATPTPTPTPFEPADFCDLNLAELLEWEIRLVVP